MNTNDVMPVLDAVKWIETLEAFEPSPKGGSGDVPQIGFATRVYPNGRAVEMTDQAITQVYAESLLVARVTDAAHTLWSYLKRIPTPDQWQALLSLADDVGADQIGPSMLVRKFNMGDVSGALTEFDKWTHRYVDAMLLDLPDRAARRSKEKELFRS